MKTNRSLHNQYVKSILFVIMFQLCFKHYPKLVWLKCNDCMVHMLKSQHGEQNDYYISLYSKGMVKECKKKKKKKKKKKLII